MVMWMRKSLGRTVTPSGPGVKAADEQGSVEPSQLESPMLHVVPEDVAHRVRHLARALQLAGVKPVGEHLAAHSVRLVEAPSHPNGQSLHATGQRDRILRLDEHVHVIALDAEMSHTEAEALLSFAERLLDGAEATRSAQARPPAGDSHRYMGWRPPRLLPRHMRHSRSRSLRLPPRAPTLPSPTPELHRKLLHRCLHPIERRHHRSARV